MSAQERKKMWKRRSGGGRLLCRTRRWTRRWTGRRGVRTRRRGRNNSQSNQPSTNHNYNNNEENKIVRRALGRLVPVFCLLRGRISGANKKQGLLQMGDQLYVKEL